jgi:diaminobutyrate-2-oxoglutarate transaminase
VELGGRDDCVVRFLPPLNVTRETLDQALDILEESVVSVAGAPRLAVV